MRPKVAEHFEDATYFGGLTYNSHPLACSAALATIRVYEEDGLIENAKKMGERMRQHHVELQERHPCVGDARNIGLFGILELIRDLSTGEPMAPFNGGSEEMKAIDRYLLDHGVYTMVRWWTIMTNPPLCINHEQLASAFSILDEALAIGDRAVRG
jgi:taurine---2-oxoglutarate transaminase